jgi:hypothetical protein
MSRRRRHSRHEGSGPRFGVGHTAPAAGDASIPEGTDLPRHPRALWVEQIDILAEISEAWQESGRDYVTAYLSGSLVDFAIDQTNGRVIAGWRTHPRPVEEFWTFTRPAGLNLWMLSMIRHLTMGTGDDPADARAPEGV